MLVAVNDYVNVNVTVRLGGALQASTASPVLAQRDVNGDGYGDGVMSHVGAFPRTFRGLTHGGGRERSHVGLHARPTWVARSVHRSGDELAADLLVAVNDYVNVNVHGEARRRAAGEHRVARARAT